MAATSLRDRLAAVLGPGNDDATAYAQADAVLDILDTEYDSRINEVCELFRQHAHDTRENKVVYQVDYYYRLRNILDPQ